MYKKKMLSFLGKKNPFSLTVTLKTVSYHCSAREFKHILNSASISLICPFTSV